MNNTAIAFLGAGNLTQALIAGLLYNQYDPKKIWASNPSTEKLDSLKQQFDVHTAQDNLQAIAQADVVVLAVKPVHIPALCAEIKAAILQRRPLIISVAAGVTVALLEKWLGADTAIIRVMPNTPATVGSGATGLYAGRAAAPTQKDLAEMIFRTVGITLWMEEEDQLDVICAVSGCGPGYIFLIMESIAATAQQLGLPEAVARLLTAQTFLGSARLALESSLSLTELRRQVTSPKGATEQIVQKLEQGGIRDLLSAAIESAVQRCAQIASNWNN